MFSFDIAHILSHASIPLLVIFALLAVLSILSWGIIIYLYRHKQQQAKQERALHQILRKSVDPREIYLQVSRLSLTGDLSSALRVGLETFYKLHAAQKNAVQAILLVEAEMEQILHEQASQRMYWISWLSTISASTPFIGLLGTVWGVIQTFSQLAHVKHASLQAVAPGIAEALIATAIALCVAIPASIAHHRWLTKRTQIGLDQAHWLAKVCQALRVKYASSSPAG